MSVSRVYTHPEEIHLTAGLLLRP